MIAVSPAAAALLGMTPSHIAEIADRFELLSASGRPIGPDERPLQRAARAELFEVGGLWRDRETGRELSVRFRGRAVGPNGLLEIDSLVEDAERRAIARLAKLNEALLGRTPGQGFISIRELLLQLVLHACEITGARYGAMGVLAPDRTLEDFVYVGVPEDAARAIGHLPEGKGLLGAVIQERATVRVPDIAQDARSSGFPASHPPMTSFLGVPLRVGEEVFGNFYLTDKQGGGPFTEEDARVLERFSAQASLTVAYARQVEQDERRLFEIVVQHAPHGIVYFPADPRAEVLGNPAAERMLGLVTRGNDPSRTYDLKHPDGSPLADDELPSSRALRLEALINVELVIERRRGGTAIPALVSAAPVRSPSGVKLGAVVIFQDITALKQLQQLSRDFMAHVAHDLRTPLQSVLLQVEALLRRAEGDAATVPIPTLNAMKRSGQQLDRLVRDLLDASRVDARGITLDLAPVRLPELVSSIVAQIQGTLGTHAVAIEVTGNPPPVSADPRRVEQIVTNLLENASKYSGEGTPIRVVIAPVDGGASLAFHDQGPGISPDELPRLFDRYFQAQRARGKRRGLGLGLFITKGLVEAHGGTITVESVPGVGSTFRIWLRGL